MSLPSTQIFERLQRAQAAWTHGGATVTVSSTTPTGVARATYRLDLDGSGGATLRIKNPQHGKLAATDQAFVLKGNRVLGYDLVARESLVRPAPDRGPINLRLYAVLGGLDDAVGFLTSADVRTRYLRPLQALSGWKRTLSGLVRRTQNSGRTSLTELDLDSSGRLNGLHIVLPTSRLDWTIAYGPAVSLAVPRGLRPVDAFTVRLQPPHYDDASAKIIAEGMLRAGGRLRSAIVRVDNAATVWIAGSRLRYESDGKGFAYDGRTLTLVTPGAAYQGRSSRGAIIDQTASLLGAVDPLVRSVLVRTPLYADLFPPEARVKAVGTMSSGGQSCDVLKVVSPRFQASIFVRTSDHLPLSIETEALDGHGNALSRTTRTLAWSAVGAALPDSLFAIRLPVGKTVLPLPKRVRGPIAP